MRNVAWICGCLLAISCSVRPVEDGDGGGGHAAAGTNGQGGHAAAGTNGQGGRGGSGVAGSNGQGGSAAAGTNGQGGSAAAGTNGQGGSAAAGTNGQGGRGGSGVAGSNGQGGRGGSGAGGSGGANCTQLEADYTAALAQAKKCNALSGAGQQCQFLVSISLSCPSCKTHVNTTSALDDIQTRYQQAGCNAVPHICPAIACINPGTGTCMPIASGDLCQ